MLSFSGVFMSSVVCGFVGVLAFAAWTKYAPVPPNQAKYTPVRPNQYGTKPLGGSVALRLAKSDGPVLLYCRSGQRAGPSCMVWACWEWHLLMRFCSAAVGRSEPFWVLSSVCSSVSSYSSFADVAHTHSAVPPAIRKNLSCGTSSFGIATLSNPSKNPRTERLMLPWLTTTVSPDSSASQLTTRARTIS